MPYVPNPFNPTIPSVNQVENELRQANINFSILAQYCQDDDPNTFMLKPSVIPPVAGGYKNVNLSSATSDYFLQVGEQAVINFSNVSSVPLHIATASGTYYELDIIPAVIYATTGTNNSTRLLPNNTTYSNSIQNACLYGNSYYNPSIYLIRAGHFALTYQNNLLPHLRAVINNYTGFKTVFAFCVSLINDNSSTSYFPYFTNSYGMWIDTTINWTSLGTITFPSAVSGTILVRRLK